MVELGYTSIEFYHSTPIEIDSALEYAKQKQEINVLTHVMPIAEAVRTNAIILFNSNVDKKDRIKDSRRLIMFPWEVEAMKTKKAQTVEQMKLKFEQIAAAFGVKKKE